MRESIYAHWIRRLRTSLVAMGALIALLVLVGPLQHVTPDITPGRPAEVQAQFSLLCPETFRNNFVVPVGTPDVIVQDCDWREIGYTALESQAIDNLLELHQLPASDRSRIRAWERDAVRGLVFTKLMAMILKDPVDRTPGEQALVDAIEDFVNLRRVRAAQFSLSEYDRWAANPCTYGPPHGLPAFHDYAWCAGTGGLLRGVISPTLQEFLQFGYAEVYQDFKPGGIAHDVAAQAALWVGAVGGFLAIGGALAAALIAAPLLVSSALASTLFPFAMPWYAGTISTVLGPALGAAAAIIVVAIVIAVIAIINVIVQDQIPAQLQAGLTQAQAGVDIRELAQTDGGKAEIYAAFILATLPDFPDLGSVPAAQTTDRTFLISILTAPGHHSTTLTYQCWNTVECPEEGGTRTARIHEGWFVDKDDASGAEKMTLGIDYVNWNGEEWTASRIGPQTFLHTRMKDDLQSFESDRIFYLGDNGVPLMAVLNHPPTQPPAPVASDTLNNGAFELSWPPGSTDEDGDAFSYTLTRCAAATVALADGVEVCNGGESTVATGLKTTSYEFTDGDREDGGTWRYRVQAVEDANAFSGDYSPFSETILVDSLAPTIQFWTRTPANEHGWNNGNVEVVWTCNDYFVTVPPIPNSGLVTGGLTGTVEESATTEGSNQSLTGTCEDNAGNTRSHTVDSINIDKTPPVAAFDGPYVVDEGSSIQLSSTNSTDNLSGILSAAFALDGDDQFDDGDPATFNAIDGPSNPTVKLRVEDKAGNVAIAETTVTVNNVAPTVNAPVVNPAPSNEGQSVVASATFSDPGGAPSGPDTHTCTVDYGDGSGPQDGVVNGTTCTGPSHTYLDDSKPGTASDDYPVTIMVTDKDGASHDSTVDQTVNNLPPDIIDITTNAPVPQGQNAMITVHATDAGGAGDPLTYRFDCDNDGSYETAGAGNSGECTLDPTAAVTTIGVEVSDDDLGASTGSVEIKQTLLMCGNAWTGAMTMPGPGGVCNGTTMPLVLPSTAPMTLCMNMMNGGELSWSPSGQCSQGQYPHIVPTSGPLHFCRDLWTGTLKGKFGPGQCGVREVAGVIPG